jgi:hypothetical protein
MLLHEKGRTNYGVLLYQEGGKVEPPRTRAEGTAESLRILKRLLEEAKTPAKKAQLTAKVAEYQKKLDGMTKKPKKGGTPAYQEGGRVLTDGDYTFDNREYRKEGGKWSVHDGNKFVPLTKGDTKKRSAVLDKMAKPKLEYPSYGLKNKSDSTDYRVGFSGSVPPSKKLAERYLNANINIGDYKDPQWRGRNQRLVKETGYLK